MKLPRAARLAALAAAWLVVRDARSAPEPKAPGSAGARVGATADETVTLAAEHARGAGEASALVAALTVADAASSARHGAGSAALARIAREANLGEAERGELALLAQRVDRTGKTEEDARGVARREGVLGRLAVLGPFRDTGGGLDAHDGPEARGFADRDASFGWGTVEVRWRTVDGLGSAGVAVRGAPLALLVHPRRESCTWVTARFLETARETRVLRVAATGQLRVLLDGREVARDEDAHEDALLDRVAVRFASEPGAHRVAVKTCTGAADDAGRVRVRLTDGAGRGVSLDAPADGAADVRAAEGAQPERTWLARALAVDPARATLDEGLADALARTVGGADDQRSPRGPGIFDAVVRRPDAGPDTLAMLGAQSPARANRSGWLRLAEAHATADARVRAFVARRRVETHLDAGLADWALAEAKAVGLDRAEDEEGRTIHARALDAVGVSTLRAEAAARLRPLVERDAEGASTDALLLANALGRRGDAALVRKAAPALGFRGVASAWLDLAELDGGGQVPALARRVVDADLEAPDPAFRAAALVARAGMPREALALWEQLVRTAPNRAEPFTGLARARATFQGDDVVLPLLQRARALEPADAAVRAEAELRTPNADASRRRPDERWLTATSAILARRRGAGQGGTPDAVDRQLHWLRAVTLHPDGRVSQLVQYAREVVVEPKGDQDLEENLPQEGDLTEILTARVHRKGGGVAFPLAEERDGSRPRVRWPDLAAGDVVEVTLRTWTSRAVGGRGDAPFTFVDYSGSTASHPILYNEVVVEHPKARPLHVAVVDGGPHVRQERDEGDRRVLRLVWDRPVTVPDEPLSPPLSEIVPIVVGSTFGSWDEFRAWYRGAIAGFTVPDEQVKRVAAELVKGKRTRDEKLRALFEFVSDDIRYVNYVSGEWWLPNRPQQLLARREGDCDDKALLLITLLRAVGIEAEEVMVQTRLTGMRRVLQAKGVAAPLFDHGIAYLPGAGGAPGRWLDATSPRSRLGPLPSMDARGLALRLDAPGELVELPASSPKEHGAEVTWDVDLAADGDAVVVGREEHAGDSAFWLRSEIAEKDARRAYVEAALGASLPAVTLDADPTFDGERAEGRARLAYKAHSLGFARRDAGELVVPVGLGRSWTSDLASLPTRRLPVLLPPQLAPSHQDRTVRVRPPAGFAFGRLPPGGKVDGGELGSARLELKREGDRVVVTRSFVLDRHLVEPERYAAFRAFLERVDALFNVELRATRTTRAAGHGAGR